MCVFVHSLCILVLILTHPVVNPLVVCFSLKIFILSQDSGRIILIIATTSIASKLERLGLTQRFNIAIDVPPITEPSEFQAVMQEWSDMDPEIAKTISKELPEPIPIKRLLMVLEMARQNSDSGEVTSDTFHKCLFDCGYRSIEGVNLSK
jgi:hypothetical protein